MSRAERLLSLMQVLRRHRYPVAGQDLASELGISLRTLYRDVTALRAQGAPIEGEAGLGYVLRPGFMLPPLMFSEEEIEALVLGAQWAAERGDSLLAAAAQEALAKIAAVLPDDLRESLHGSPLRVIPVERIEAGDAELPIIREAIRKERKLEISYRDADGAETRRRIWPFAIGFFERARVVAAWCEMRQAFRHFRTDRIAGIAACELRYPRRRHALMKAWREAEGIRE